jgi:hypothetical protein
MWRLKVCDLRQGAINDLTVAAEFIMVAVRAIAAGKPVEDRDVQENVSWAIRKLAPLDKSSLYGAQLQSRRNKDKK